MLSEKSDSLYKNIENSSEHFKNLAKDFESKMEGNKIESVTVITIFSAIVFAFTGGLSLLGSAFNALSKSSEIEVLLTISVIGIIMFNVIFGLMVAVFDIIHKDDVKLKRWKIILAIEIIFGTLIGIFLILQNFL